MERVCYLCLEKSLEGLMIRVFWHVWVHIECE